MGVLPWDPGRVERNSLTTKGERKVVAAFKNAYILQQSYLVPRKGSFLYDVRTRINLDKGYTKRVGFFTWAHANMALFTSFASVKCKHRQ